MVPPLPDIRPIQTCSLRPPYWYWYLVVATETRTGSTYPTGMLSCELSGEQFLFNASLLPKDAVRMSSFFGFVTGLQTLTKSAILKKNSCLKNVRNEMVLSDSEQLWVFNPYSWTNAANGIMLFMEFYVKNFIVQPHCPCRSNETKVCNEETDEQIA